MGWRWKKRQTNTHRDTDKKQGTTRHRDTNIQEANRQGAIKKKKSKSVNQSINQRASRDRQTSRKTDHLRHRERQSVTRTLDVCLCLKLKRAALTDASFSIVQKLVALPTSTLGLPFNSHHAELVTAEGILVAGIYFTCNTLHKSSVQNHCRYFSRFTHRGFVQCMHLQFQQLNKKKKFFILYSQLAESGETAMMPMGCRSMSLRSGMIPEPSYLLARSTARSSQSVQ